MSSRPCRRPSRPIRDERHGGTVVRAALNSDTRTVDWELRESDPVGAEQVAHWIGAVALVAQATHELEATGARPRTLLKAGPETLTASERRVAHLAAEGLSNKAIAQALFLTVKTIEVHLSSVYRKLGIGSRRELPGALAMPEA
jgi:DNA-binding CsgD family transcriptional regulator